MFWHILSYCAGLIHRRTQDVHSCWPTVALGKQASLEVLTWSPKILHFRLNCALPLCSERNTYDQRTSHSRPQRLWPFWSAPRIETSGQLQMHVQSTCSAVYNQLDFNNEAVSVGSSKMSRFLVLTKIIAVSASWRRKCELLGILLPVIFIVSFGRCPVSQNTYS